MNVRTRTRRTACDGLPRRADIPSIHDRAGDGRGVAVVSTLTPMLPGETCLKRSGMSALPLLRSYQRDGCHPHARTAGSDVTLDQGKQNDNDRGTKRARCQEDEDATSYASRSRGLLVRCEEVVAVRALSYGARLPVPVLILDAHAALHVPGASPLRARRAWKSKNLVGSALGSRRMPVGCTRDELAAGAG